MISQEKYINLFTDFGFKRVFGEEANKDILMDFGEKEREAYEQSRKHLLDLNNVINTAFGTVKK